MEKLTFILLFTTLVSCIAQETSESCGLKGKETFVLATNVMPTVRPYATVADQSLEECTGECAKQSGCKSVVVSKNQTTSTCFMYLEKATNLQQQSSEVENSMTGFYYLEKQCLKGVCNRLFAFEVMANSSLAGYSHHLLRNVSMSQCLESCLSWKVFPCKSVEYDPTYETCSFSRYDRYGRSTSFGHVNRTVFYYDNNCATQQSFEGATAEVILLGNAQHPYVISEYGGTTVGECGQLCLQNDKFPCRSFLYGKRRGTNYCALSHQNRVGLLRNSNSFTPTDTINYYEIAKNSEVCEIADVHFELTTGALLIDRPFKTKINLSQKKCLEECRGDIKCHAIDIDYTRNECSFYEAIGRETVANNLRLNDSYNFFEKICLPSSKPCTKQWAFERVRGRNLASPFLRKAVVAFTKEECLASCLELQDFECKSAQYDSKLSECFLSGYNRFSISEKRLKFHRAKLDLDYYENNCVTEPRGFCNTKVHKGLSVGNAEETLKMENIANCRSACFDELHFNCRSYTYNSATGQCFLNHHTTTTIPYSLITTDDNAVTHEISSCYNVSVTCETQVMRVNVRTTTIFDGKIYVRHKADTCYSDISRNTNFTFAIPLHGSECGTQSEGEGKFSNVIVIQNNDLVLTSTDKAVGVHCTYDLSNKTEFAILTIKNMSVSETSRGRAKPPNLTMRILDLKGNDKTSVKLGEPLRVQVAVDDKSAYGIFVRNMVATDASGASNLTLIDSKGCPAEAKMIREMRRIDGQNRALESVMEAFTFTGSNVLRIETDVETCLDSCSPVVCHLPSGRSDDQYMAVESLGRRRRRKRDLENVQVFKLTKTVAVQSDMFGIGRQLKSISEEQDKDDYDEYVSVMDDTINNICVDSLVLTVGGIAFVIIQIILISTCLATKYSNDKQRKKLESQRESTTTTTTFRTCHFNHVSNRNQISSEVIPSGV